MSSFKRCDVYKNFVVKNVRKVPELSCELIEVTHTPSGAKIIHLPSDDSENFFCISLKTLPTSSNGVAHILEHLALCGSKHFPVKDPFFSMTRRSMNTFMNAFTGSDFTCYPAASQIEKDFYNLLEVYIDAVFYPNLNPLSFLQEGHRLEFSSDDPTSLSITGVVYNEMKGALSNPMRRLVQELYARLFPTSPYGYNSGGDPEKLTTLSLEELISFHKNYYHPSRSLFFFYGNIPLTTHLDFLEQKILFSTSSPLPPLTPPSPQERFLKPFRSHIEYPASQEEINRPSSFLAFSWLTTTIDNQLECLALTLLDSMLLSTDASPLKLALLQTGKCRQVSSSCDTEIPDVPFSIILTGCQEEDIQILRETLFETISDIAKKGFSQNALDTALHELEFAKSEITCDGSPFGLSLFFRAGLLAQHGVDPLRGLEIHSLFDTLRSLVTQDPSFFSVLLSKYFLSNPHLVEIIMTPSTTKEEEEQVEEKKFIQKTLASLTSQDKDEIIHNTAALKKLQEEDQDVSCLPMLRLGDVPKECKKISLSRERLGSLDLFSHVCFTNKICYTSIIQPLAHIPEEDLWLLRLFSLLFTQLGCGNRTYDKALSDMQSFTGGIYSNINIIPQASNSREYSFSFTLKGKCLNRNLEKLFSMLFDYLTSPRLDEEKRMREIIEKHSVDLRSSLQAHSLDYAMSQAGKSISPARTIYEHMYGLSYFKKIQELTSSFSEKKVWLFEKLHKVSSTILHTGNMHSLFCGDGESLLSAKENSLWGIADISGKPYHPFCAPTADPQQKDHFFLLPTKVSSTALVFPTVSYTHQDAPLLSLLSSLMNNTFLHKKIREQGGAYGGGSSAHTTAGTFSFYSYKDPNLYTTFQAYDQVRAWIKQGLFTKENIEEAKLSVLQDLDAPIAPGHRTEVAYMRWRQGKDDEIRQHFRDGIINATKESLQKLVPTYFSDITASPFVAFTNKETAESNRAFFETNGNNITITSI